MSGKAARDRCERIHIHTLSPIDEHLNRPGTLMPPNLHVEHEQRAFFGKLLRDGSDPGNKVD